MPCEVRGHCEVMGPGGLCHGSVLVCLFVARVMSTTLIVLKSVFLLFPNYRMFCNLNL